MLWPWQTAKLLRLSTSNHVLITAGTRIITCVSRVLHVLTTCAVRACPRSKVSSSSKLYSASDAVPIFSHVLPRPQRGCSSSSTRTTSAVSRETTFWRFLAVIKPSSAVWPGLEMLNGRHQNHESAYIRSIYIFIVWPCKMATILEFITTQCLKYVLIT